MYYDVRDLWPLLVRAGFRPSRIQLLLAQARAQHVRRLRRGGPRRRDDRPAVAAGAAGCRARASDWVDLQWSLDRRAAARGGAARPRAGCSTSAAATSRTRPIFAPYVTEYIGIEHEATFGATAAGGRGRAPT